MVLQANVNKLFRNLQLQHVKCNFLNGLDPNLSPCEKAPKQSCFSQVIFHKTVENVLQVIVAVLKF